MLRGQGLSDTDEGVIRSSPASPRPLFQVGRCPRNLWATLLRIALGDGFPREAEGPPTECLKSRRFCKVLECYAKNPTLSISA